MKNHSSRGLGRFASRAWLMLVFVFNAVAMPAAADPAEAEVSLDIGVRSVVESKWIGLRKLAKVAHGKLYALASVTEAPSAQKMVRPVDRGALVTHLRREMAARGYREITENEKAEVVLTVIYGRGYLRNPYFADAHLDEVSDGPVVSTITSARQAMRQRQAGFEAKAQNAQQEKLFIAVTAWAYPKPDEKLEQLWRTTMLTDDPAHRDLNLAMPAMLAAGVRYFDEDVAEEEITINSKVPAGTVKLGPLNVIEMGGEKPGK